MSLRSGRIITLYVLSLILSADAVITHQIAASGRKPAVRTSYYSAGRGTLPTQQGFRLVNSDSDHPPAVIEGKTLQQGPTSRHGTQYWRTNSILLDFSPSGRGVSAEWVVRVDQSTYHRSPHFRTGWHVGIRDKQQRLFLVFVGTDRVALVNGDPDRRPAVAKFDAAGKFHHYRLVVDDELAMLFVDGSKKPIVSKHLI